MGKQVNFRRLLQLRVVALLTSHCPTGPLGGQWTGYAHAEPPFRATIVNASVAWQSRRRRNGGSWTCVRPYRAHRDCHVATLLAMTDQGGCAWDVVRSRRPTFVIASVAWQSRRRSNGGLSTCVRRHRAHRDCRVAVLLAMTDYSGHARAPGASCLPTLSLRAQRGNLVGVATAVRRRVFSVIELIEIATSLRSSQ